MKPWVQWMIDHNMKFAVLLLAALLIPFFVVVYVWREVDWKAIPEGLLADFKFLISAKKRQPK